MHETAGMGKLINAALLSLLIIIIIIIQEKINVAFSSKWTLTMTFSGHDDSTINVVLGLLLLLLLLLPFCMASSTSKVTLFHPVIIRF